LENKIDNLDNQKVDKDSLAAEILRLKRFIRNSEFKTMKFLEISEEIWDGHVNEHTETLELENQKPLSFMNGKIMNHINVTNFLRSILSKKQEYIRLFEYSKSQYDKFAEFSPSDNKTVEEIQKEKFLSILSSINLSIISDSEYMKDGEPQIFIQKSSRKQSKQLSKKSTKRSPRIKQYNLKNPIKHPSVQSSSSESLTIIHRPISLSHVPKKPSLRISSSQILQSYPSLPPTSLRKCPQSPKNFYDLKKGLLKEGEVEVG
jgi:hypothetical protein